MNKNQVIDELLNKNGGVLLTKKVINAGISKTHFMDYVKKNALERLAMGIYLSADAWLDAFYILQIRYPHIIFSHETALYLLGFAEREPIQITVTAKTGYHSVNMRKQNVKVYQIKNELLELGVVTVKSPAGNVLRAYNPERTICDLLRSRSQVEIQDLQGALKEYTKSRKKNIPLLMRYAKEFHVDKLARMYLEVLL